MATVNFSVPDDVKEALKDQNRSAAIADLMREAIERQQRRKRHVDAIDRILARRKLAPAMTEEEFHLVREEGRS